MSWDCRWGAYWTVEDGEGSDINIVELVVGYII